MSSSSAPQSHWVSPADDETDEQQARQGMTMLRALYQMRRTLPLSDEIRSETRPIAVRRFRPGHDDDGFLRVNNRAFSWHPDQGGWTGRNLADRMAEPWFSTDGFLIHDTASKTASDTASDTASKTASDTAGETDSDTPDGRADQATDDTPDATTKGAPDHPVEAATIDGFCWTKVHPPTEDDPAMGEIFVIAADPSTHGTGLGRALTVAGLDYLAGLGLEVAMLYVEHDNEAAIGLYERLGFTVHHRDALYGPVPPT